MKPEFFDPRTVSEEGAARGDACDEEGGGMDGLPPDHPHSCRTAPGGMMRARGVRVWVRFRGGVGG